ncbi:MAG: cytochrome P460 family protein [Rhodospirillaceae bacterium]
MGKRFSLSAIAVASAAALSAAAADVAEVPYPEGYRNWHHVKSMVIGEGHALVDSFEGIHHLYANEAAVRGYRTGNFADGSVIVFDLLEANEDGGALVEGPRKVLGVMHKDRAAYKSTGGWGFEGFTGDSKTERAITQQNAATACFACHAQLLDSDYVFSTLRK